MDHLPEHVWRSLEKQGREHFIWKERVLSLGVPGTLLMIIWGLLYMGIGWKDLLHGKGLGYVFLTSLTGVAITYKVAALEWDDHKKKYDGKTPQ
jgi:hypothetical protein